MLARTMRNNFKDIKFVEPEEFQESDIVENPEEVIVHFPIISDLKADEKLPFFKSIIMKLTQL